MGGGGVAREEGSQNWRDKLCGPYPALKDKIVREDMLLMQMVAEGLIKRRAFDDPRFAEICGPRNRCPTYCNYLRGQVYPKIKERVLTLRTYFSNRKVPVMIDTWTAPGGREVLGSCFMPRLALQVSPLVSMTSLMTSCNC